MEAASARRPFEERRPDNTKKEMKIGSKCVFMWAIETRRYVKTRRESEADSLGKRVSFLNGQCVVNRFSLSKNGKSRRGTKRPYQEGSKSVAGGRTAGRGCNNKARESHVSGQEFR